MTYKLQPDAIHGITGDDRYQAPKKAPAKKAPAKKAVAKKAPARRTQAAPTVANKAVKPPRNKAR